MTTNKRQDGELQPYLNKLLDEMPLLEPSAGFTDRVMQRVNGHAAAESAPRKRQALWVGELINGSVAIAATFAFIGTGIIGKLVTFDTQIAQLSLYIEKLSRLIHS